MDSIFLKMLDFSIKMSIKRSKFSFFNDYADHIKKHIRNNYNEFLIDKTSKVDLKIKFVDLINPDIFTKKHNNKTLYYSKIFEDAGEDKITAFYPLTMSEFRTVLQFALYNFLPKKEAFILHSSAVIIDNGAYLFLGRSGAGKSTAMKMLSSKYIPFSDDIVIVRKLGDKFYVFKSPLIEREKALTANFNTKYELKKIFFLKKNSVFKIEEITNKDHLLLMLIKQSRVEEVNLKYHIKNIAKFLETFTEIYYLYFAKKEQEMIKFFENLT